MIKRLISSGTIALMFVGASGRQSSMASEANAITVQPGQGSPITLAVPAETEAGEAPYMLAGEHEHSTPADPVLRQDPVPVLRQYGQGSPVWIMSSSGTE